MAGVDEYIVIRRKVILEKNVAFSQNFNCTVVIR